MRAKILQVAAIVLGLGAFALAGPVTITFGSGGGTSPGGVAYYPYTITVSTEGTITVACDDYIDHVTPGETYSGWESTYSDLSHTSFYSQPNSTQNYDELAYLYSQLQPVPPDNNTENAALNYAMWELFDTGHGPGDAFTNDPTLSNSGVDSSSYWLGQAASWYTGGGASSFNFTNFRIFSPVLTDTNGWTDGQPQEFIGEVPEPASLALLGTGLLLLAFVFKRRLSGEAGADGKALDLQS